MATTKQATKKPIAKSSTARKAPAKRATSVRTKKVTQQQSWDLPSGGNFKSFKVGKVRNFFTVRITDQTIYWSILCFIILALGVWVVTIDDKVQRLYDQIDADNLDSNVAVPVKKAS